MMRSKTVAKKRESKGLTPTKQRIMDLLMDGYPHTMASLIGCLYDAEMGTSNGVKVHITQMRPELRRNGQDIICQFLDGGTFYRLVRLTNDPYRG